MSDRQNTAGGLSVCTVVTIVFVILKLTDNIDWSWVWVLSPLWLGWSLVLLIVLVCALIVGVNMTVEKMREKDRLSRAYDDFRKGKR